MKLVPSSQGLFAKVDDEDFDNVMQYNWAAEIRKNTNYASSNLGRGRGAPRIRLHRFIMNPPSNMQIDHEDLDGLNCQRYNMRLATHKTNGRNTIVPQGENGSGYRGVYKHHYSERWIVRIRDTDGNKIHIGTYPTPIDAAKAYDEAAKKYHGEFATLNFKE